jgi:hypothetical protein
MFSLTEIIGRNVIFINFCKDRTETIHPVSEEARFGKIRMWRRSSILIVETIEKRLGGAVHCDDCRWVSGEQRILFHTK